MSMNCREISIKLSSYLDHALDGKQRSQVRQHLNACMSCEAELEQLGSLRQMMRDHARVQAPDDLALQIRMRVSHESRPAISAWSRLMVHLENMLGPVAIPAATGILTAILIFGGFVYNFAVPLSASSNYDDVPLALQTPPRLRAVPRISFTANQDGVAVLTEIDNQGRVIDFHVLNGTADPQQIRELRQLMVFTQFDPATRFGVPIPGRAIITLRGISVNVKG
jgi:anti-sigma factor RsiW